MTISLVNFKLNSDNPDDQELLAFFEIAKTFGLTKTDICKLAVKRLAFDITAGNLQDGSFSPHFTKAILESEKITYLGRTEDNAQSTQKETTPTIRHAIRHELEITDEETTGPVTTEESVEVSPAMADKLKNILGG